MYAVIESGGRQYRVEPGQQIKLGKLAVEEGQSFDFDKILAVSANDSLCVGLPHLKSAKVTATVMSHGRDKKIHILKFKRRKHHMKRMGHRQDHTIVKITAIEAGDGQ
jgi:large subunit ribosomal protein L21